jgi:hypothetical protein
VSTNVVKWRECLSNWVPIIIRKYIDHMRFAAYMAVSLIIRIFSYSFVLLCIIAHVVVCRICFFLIL